MPEVTRQEPLASVRFGDYELDRARGVLFRRGVALKLQPQPLRALTFLIDCAPEIVSREALGDHIWGDGVHVEVEQSLNYCIRQIRQVLDDRPSNPKFVETLPRQGYRFIGTVILGPGAGKLTANEADLSQSQSGGTEESRQEKSPIVSMEPVPGSDSRVLSRRTFVWAAGVTAVAGGGLWLGG